MQSLYATTFDLEQFKAPHDYFQPSITMDQIRAIMFDRISQRLGCIGYSCWPVVISSVTYGQMALFTATSTTATDALQFQNQLQAAATAWRTHATITNDTKSFLTSLKYHILAIGGDQEAVATAIKSGDWSGLYADSNTTPVPIRFTLRDLVRPPETVVPNFCLGWRFTTADCTPLPP
jgi:hypothetical protein